MNRSNAPHRGGASAIRDRPTAGWGERPLRQTFLRSVVRFPLFYKVVLGNALLLVAGMLTAVWLVHPGGVVTLAPGGLALLLAILLLSLCFNALLVFLALLPLRQLEETARRVRKGDLSARAPCSSLADRRLEGLIRVFNHMLESVEALRRRHRQLTVRALESEERERTRISTRLFDETAQALATVLLRLRIAARLSGGPAGPEALESLRQDLGDALAEVQRLARELRPPEIEEVGIVAALEARARMLSQTTGVSIRVQGPTQEPALSWPVRVALFRVLQEALDNAVRHSGAGQVEVSLHADDHRVQAEVADAGIGFDPKTLAAESGRGLGLFELSERMAHLGGSATIESAPGEGTRIIVEVPIDRPARLERGALSA